jgi:hypothetical protein
MSIVQQMGTKTGAEFKAHRLRIETLEDFSEATTSLNLVGNQLEYTDEDGVVTTHDLSLYLDDTNLARLVNGTLDSQTGIATFTRDDGSTFTVDFSAFFDDTQVVVNDTLTSTSTTEALSANQGKVLNANKLGINAKAVDSDKLDGKDSSEFALAHSHPFASDTHNHDTNYLGITATASNASKLENKTLATIKTEVVDSIVNGAGGAYDTLKELETEIKANDGDISTVITNLGDKVSKTSSQAMRATDALTVSDDTITIHKGDGTSESVSIADSNTWRSISDSVTSTSNSVSASSNAVKTAYDKANHSHPYLGSTAKAVDSDKLDGQHASAFATSAQGTLATNALPKTGGTMTGKLTLNAVTPQIDFNGTSDSGVDMAIKATPEGLDFFEPEDSNKIHFQILDDAGVNAPYGYKVGTTSVIESDAKIDANKIKNVPASWLIGDTDTNTWRSISDSVTSTSTSVSASSKAVKTAYDKANHSHNYLPSSGGRIDNGTNTTVEIKCDDAGKAMLNVSGDGQGTGQVYVGQSNDHGGGIEYNGDNNPSTTGAGSDHITLFRKAAGTYTWTARNQVNSNNWEFRGDIKAPTFTGTASNADKLDGINSSQFLRSDADDTMNGTLTLQSTGSVGININADTDNATETDLPFMKMTQDGGIGELTVGVDNNSPYIFPNRTDNADQNSDNNQLHIKQKNGTFGKVWHSLNDGAGSGLDADKLDGKDSSAFNQIIGTDSDINTSGATIVDNIYVTDGVITSMGTRTLTPADIGAATTADLAGGLTDSGHSYATNGYQKLSNGLIIQWGKKQGAGKTLVTFPIAFPTACLNVNLVTQYNGYTTANGNIYPTPTTTSFYGHIYNTSYYGYWFAIGY